MQDRWHIIYKPKKVYCALLDGLPKILFLFSRNFFWFTKPYHFFPKKDKTFIDRLSLLKSLQPLIQDYTLKGLEGQLMS